MPIDAKAFLGDMRDLNAAIRNAAVQALRAALKDAEADAKGTTLYRDVTGMLRKNTVATQSGPLDGELRASTKYAYWIENGTPPHVINAKPGGSLSFVANGSRVFAKSVRHPGTAERPFMQHARDVGEKSLDYGADYLVSEAITRSR